jgi:hypothetical protein
MEIKLGKIGIITEGKMKGYYIRIDDDFENTGGFLIIYNSAPDMSSSNGYDDWVENEECLRDFCIDNSWIVNWIEN